ncbi:hypothetical protein ScPMuIL_009526 [Solemya velum]
MSNGTLLSCSYLADKIRKACSKDQDGGEDIKGVGERQCVISKAFEDRNGKTTEAQPPPPYPGNSTYGKDPGREPYG